MDTDGDGVTDIELHGTVGATVMPETAADDGSGKDYSPAPERRSPLPANTLRAATTTLTVPVLATGARPRLGTVTAPALASGPAEPVDPPVSAIDTSLAERPDLSARTPNGWDTVGAILSRIIRAARSVVAVLGNFLF